MVRITIGTEDESIEFERDDVAEAFAELREIFMEEPELLDKDPEIYVYKM